jgi:hypothetical protein
MLVQRPTQTEIQAMVPISASITTTENKTEQGSTTINSTFVLLGFLGLMVYNFRNR